ncbi:phosphatase PAP2 family protein [Patescibacteria group bacterium]
MPTIIDTLLHQFYVVSLFGDSIFVFLIITSLLLLFLLKNFYQKEAYILIISNASYAYSVLLKYLFKHPRPITADFDSLNFFDYYSFPSTHVLVYTAFWGYILYVLVKKIRKEKKKLAFHALAWISVYFITFVGASRIALGMHNLKDVIAGYFFGLTYLLFLIFLDKKFDKIFSKN